MYEISVIVPVYNGEKTIEKSIRSLLNQTMSVEIIVVNDGSKDHTQAVVERLASEYANIHLYNKKNEGIAATRNFGLSKVETPYFGFLDADDWLREDAYEKMYQKIREKDDDLCICDFLWVYENGEERYQKDTGYQHKKALITGMFATLWNKLYKTAWVKDSGILFPSGLVYEDASFLYRLALKMDRVCYVEEAFVYYFQKMGSITHTFNIKINDMINVFAGIGSYYKKAGCFEEYKEELEYLFIRFFMGNSYLRACRIPDKKVRADSISKAWHFLNDNFPEYRKNSYLKQGGLKNCYFRLVNKPLYFANVYLFSFLYKVGIMK